MYALSMRMKLICEPESAWNITANALLSSFVLPSTLSDPSS